LGRSTRRPERRHCWPGQGVRDLLVFVGLLTVATLAVIVTVGWWRGVGSSQVSD
jgi:hypothetical protein